MQKVYTMADLDKMASETGKKLAKQEKVEIMIAPGGDKNYRCMINGYSFEFPKGKMIEVPKDVAAFIASRTEASYAAEKQKEELKNVEV